MGKETVNIGAYF